MSIARPAVRGFLSRGLTAANGSTSTSISSASIYGVTTTTTTTCTTATATCRSFHSSRQLEARTRSRFKNVSGAQMGLVSQKDLDNYTKKHFPEYSPEEKEVLSKVYSPEQMAALEAGEASIDPKDLTIQGRLRVGPYALPYLDDFRDIQPIIDKRPRSHPPPDSKATFMNQDEFEDDFFKWVDETEVKAQQKESRKTLDDFIPDGYKGTPESEWPPEVRQVAAQRFAKDAAMAAEQADKPSPEDDDFMTLMLQRSSMTDGNATYNSLLAPALPNKVPGVAGLYSNAIDLEDMGKDDLGEYADLKEKTLLPLLDLKSLYTRVLHSRVVTNQTRLGKIQSTSSIAIAGNRDGWLGIGEAKVTGIDKNASARKAMDAAIRNMQPIPRYEKRTIYGNTEAKVGACIVQLSARPPGFGLRVPARFYEMAQAAGIHDLASKMPRGRHPLNSVKACYEALMKQKDPEEIAMGRGKKMVDVRRVYYGGPSL